MLLLFEKLWTRKLGLGIDLNLQITLVCFLKNDRIYAPFTQTFINFHLTSLVIVTVFQIVFGIIVCFFMIKCILSTVDNSLTSVEVSICCNRVTCHVVKKKKQTSDNKLCCINYQNGLETEDENIIVCI